jgi:GT2 family glycosyltransferase
MITFLNNNPEAGVVGCKLINKDGSIQESYSKVFPTPYSELLTGILLHRLKPKNNKDNDNTKAMQVAWIAGACMLFKKEILNSLNGFDKQYFMYGEDVDLCYRLKKYGLNTYYLKQIKMLHIGEVSSNKQGKAYYSAIQQKESIYRFMYTHYCKVTAFIFRIVWIFCGIVRLVLLLPAIIISRMFGNKIKMIIFNIFMKHVKIIFWGIGIK